MCLRYLSPVTNNKDPALSYVKGVYMFAGVGLPGGFGIPP